MQLRGRTLAWYFAAWVPFAVLYGLAVALSGAAPVDAALSALASTGSAALFGMAAWRVAPRRHDGTPLARWVAQHLVTGLLFSAAWTAVIAAQIRGGAPQQTWEGFVANAIRWQFVSGVILYAFLMAALSFVETSRRLREQQRLTERAEQLRVAAELQALRAQLNPHFLFNTLHSITALVRQQPAQAERALEQLATCLRHVLDVNRGAVEEVSLGDELLFVREYLALERMRFGDRLRVIEEVDPDLLDAAVLVFVLQPLVENVIRHALGPMARSVTLRMTAAARDDLLILEVGDDGPGHAGMPPHGDGVGLHAVRERLRVRYGDGASLHIVTALGEGFLVRIQLPLQSAPRRALAAGR